MTTNNLIRKAVGVISIDGKVLFVRAKNNQHWSLPGGKLEEGETHVEALIRELEEELSISVEQSCLAKLGNYSRPSGKYPGRISDVTVFIVEEAVGEITLSSEIEELRWIDPLELECDLLVGDVYKEEILPAIANWLQNEDREAETRLCI